MRLFRFMHRTELMKFVKGDKITPIKYKYVHFIAEKTHIIDIGAVKPLTLVPDAMTNFCPVEDYYVTPMEFYDDFLIGTVCRDVLAEFEIPDDQILIKAGPYANSIATEFVVESYSKDNAKLISFQRMDNKRHNWFSSATMRRFAMSLIDYCNTHPGFDIKYFDLGMVKFLRKHNIGRKWYMPIDEYKRLQDNINVVD